MNVQVLFKSINNLLFHEAHKQIKTIQWCKCRKVMRKNAIVWKYFGSSFEQKLIVKYSCTGFLITSTVPSWKHMSVSQTSRKICSSENRTLHFATMETGRFWSHIVRLRNKLAVFWEIFIDFLSVHQMSLVWESCAYELSDKNDNCSLVKVRAFVNILDSFLTDYFRTERDESKEVMNKLLLLWAWIRTYI